ncbi:TPA: hypothetical protein RNX34_002136 [Pasteurella multocida]|nr:hypothetical protein [Pasteurella multocida]QXG51752.1 hypothetical protein KSF84_01400 [Pasteurella multocida]WGE13633.1 hypothetical protein PM3_0261 [Pasteurella multocida]HDX0990402.1 hypothetical protein [Pasteurella multocida]HDX0990730.1 hypothetical protein [Pasteurella multocida]HDX1015669.1 hypothetical protein [Pasteurella multocida]
MENTKNKLLYALLAIASILWMKKSGCCQTLFVLFLTAVAMLSVFHYLS